LKAGAAVARTSKAVELVLIGSSLLLAGCGTRHPAADDWEDQSTARNDTAPTRPPHYHVGPGRAIFVPYFRQGRVASRSMSPRGGFGGIGHAVAGG